MVVLAFPTPEELLDLSEGAFSAHEDIHRIVRSIVRLHNPEGPSVITGSIQMKLNLTCEARIAYESLRREFYPTEGEVEFREEASRAFLTLEETDINIGDWEFMGCFDGCCSWSFFEFSHVRRLHDSGLAGAWILIGFIPFGAIVLLVLVLVLVLRSSKRGENQYGPDPRLAIAPGEERTPAGIRLIG